MFMISRTKKCILPDIQYFQYPTTVVCPVRVVIHPPTPIQFVPFRDYMDQSGNQVLSMARLAKDVLAEIPEQLLGFMKTRGIEPRPALSSSELPKLHRHI